jgi:predicted naringenin-chalcone synthase
MTPPPFFLSFMAPVGQTSAQGAGEQARQTLATNPVERPPEDAILIPAVFHDSNLCTNRAQAKEQEWQPMQRSIREAVNIFISSPNVLK